MAGDHIWRNLRTDTEFVSQNSVSVFKFPGGEEMPTLIKEPSIIQAAGTKPKRIEEYVGRVNSKHSTVSVARMVSPEGWVEPGQSPEFEEITVVLKGTLRVEYQN